MTQKTPPQWAGSRGRKVPSTRSYSRDARLQRVAILGVQGVAQHAGRYQALHKLVIELFPPGPTGAPDVGGAAPDQAAVAGSGGVVTISNQNHHAFAV
jgi:hypothetical protein